MIGFCKIGTFGGVEFLPMTISHKSETKQPDYEASSHVENYAQFGPKIYLDLFIDDIYLLDDNVSNDM